MEHGMASNCSSGVVQISENNKNSNGFWKDASYTFNINHAPDVSFDDCLAKPQNRCILVITVPYLSPILTYLAWVLSFSATLYFHSATFWRQMYFFTSLHLSEQLLIIVINSDYVLHQSQMSACVRLTYFFQQYHENKLHKTNTDSNNQKNAEYQIW